MAGTLTVQNLQGPSSGANANKIIVPSGQTLDASAGFVPPAGSVVQVVREYSASGGHIATSSTSLAASGLTATITPKYSDSLILVDFTTAMAYVSSTAGHIRAVMYQSIGTGSRSAMAGASLYHVGYREANTGYGPMAFGGKYTASSTTSLTFEPYFLAGSAAGVYIVHSSSSWGMTLTEIKQ